MQATSVTTEQLAEYLNSIAVRVQPSAAPTLYALLEEHALTLSNVKILHALAADSDRSVKELAEQLGLSLPGMSRALDGLLKRGIVDRHEDPEDRRMKRVFLTAAGRELLDEITSARLAGLREFAAELTDDERASLAAALLPILERLDLR